MKVVDEKGKLFGKLNIIDLLVILVILAAIVVVGLKVLGGSSTGEQPGTSGAQLTYTVRVTAQSEKVTEQIAQYVDAASGKRDQLMANDEMVNAYIVDYWTEPTSYNRLNTGGVELFDDTEAAGLVDICFVIEANVADTVTNEVGTQQVRLGKEHIVKTTHLEFARGIIEHCDWAQGE